MISRELYDSTSLMAKDLALLLQQRQKRIVFAESCTAGLVSAVMAQIPGISDRLCGSAVTYRVSVKEDWLNIDSCLIDQFSAVSPQVTTAMAQAVLAKTKDAHFSVAITGHLQPESSPHGPVVFVCIGLRQSNRITCTDVKQISLVEETRCDCQWEAACFALNVAIQFLKNSKAS